MRAAVATLDAEAARFGVLLDTLEGDDWERPTTSGWWCVRETVGHTVGQFEGLGNVTVMMRRLRAARHRYPEMVALDGHNQVQLDDYAAATPAELRSRFARYRRSGVRAMRFTPSFVRRVRAERFFPGSVPPDTRLAYVFDVLAARDTWMHRVEIHAATGRDFVATRHDGVIVAQVVRDLSEQWTGPPVTLRLTGAAGGEWSLGRVPPAIRAAATPTTATTPTPANPPAADPPRADVTADAIAMMLHLSGRPAGIDAGPLDTARVVF